MSNKMITPLAVHELSLKNKGYKIKPKNGELRITKNGAIDDVKINCVYTKKEIDELLQNVKPGDKDKDESYFKLKESDQLYLYKPSSIDQTSDYYVMSWVINPEYDIPPQTKFIFKDYLFNHTWLLNWDGDKWAGNNVVNVLFNKQSTYSNNNGKPGFIIQHTDRIAKWIKCLDDTSENFATTLAKYVTNWKVVYKDGNIVELTDSIIELSEAPSYEINGVKCDIQQFEVKVPNSISGTDILYLLADINIDGDITPLKWDCHPTHPITSHYIQTWNDNPLIELFNYARQIRFESNDSSPKNIYIYIEKKYFDQLPDNAPDNYNPFDVIIAQQFYEVRPDPRECTTLSIDYNIYSSKIIWADNIKTMRRDLNVVGGNVDVLFYDYTLLKQLMDSFQEQMRLQAAYNEYTDSIRKGLSVAESVLNILAGTVKLASEFSNLTATPETITLNTYTTEPYRFPWQPGGEPIEGNFLVDASASSGRFISQRFLPSTTTVALTSAELTADQLIMNAVDAVTQIGDASTNLIAGGLTFNRVPGNNITQSTQRLTDSVHELQRSWRDNYC